VAVGGEVGAFSSGSGVSGGMEAEGQGAEVEFAVTDRSWDGSAGDVRDTEGSVVAVIVALGGN
jgi:hypothetical protein